jgi:hypothetical protein
MMITVEPASRKLALVGLASVLCVLYVQHSRAFVFIPHPLELGSWTPSQVIHCYFKETV